MLSKGCREGYTIFRKVSKVSYRFTAVVRQEGSWFVAQCAENNVASQGKTLETALESLKEALALYYEDSEKPLLNAPTYITSVEVAI